MTALTIGAVLAVGFVVVALWKRRHQPVRRFGLGLKVKTASERIEALTAPENEPTDPEVKNRGQQLADIWETLQRLERRLSNQQDDPGDGWKNTKRKYVGGIMENTPARGTPMSREELMRLREQSQAQIKRGLEESRKLVKVLERKERECRRDK